MYYPGLPMLILTAAVILFTLKKFRGIRTGLRRNVWLLILCAGFTLFAIYVVYFILDILLNLIKVDSTRTVWGIPYTVRVTPWWITVPLALIGIGIAVFSIIGIINAATGKAKKLPLIGNIDVLGWFKK